MPASYQAPMRGDSTKQASSSQSTSSNMGAGTVTVGNLLAQKDGSVSSIEPGETLHHAVELLRDHRIGALVVTEGGALAGILSERDIVRKLAETPGQTLPQKVGDVMTRKVETCGADEPVISVLKRMTAGRFRHMPVVDGGRLVGMVTIGDVVNYRLNELEYEALQLKQLIVG